MDRAKLDVRAPQGAVSVAALALFGSAIAAIATRYILRRTLLSSGPRLRPTPVQPAIGKEMPDAVPSHFTEDLIVPGFTATGADVERQDDVFERSPSGV